MVTGEKPHAAIFPRAEARGMRNGMQKLLLYGEWIT